VANIILTREIIIFVLMVKYAALFFLRSQTHNKSFAAKVLLGLSFACQYFDINPTLRVREN